MRASKSQVAGLLFLLAIYTGMGLLSVLFTPLASFPDEVDHLNYVRHVRAHHELPKLSFRMEEIKIFEAFQPPLYYVCSALLFFPQDEMESNVLRIRIFSLLLGAGAILLTWRSALLVLPKSGSAALLIPVFAALNPQFIFSHAGISNISMTTFCCSLTAYLAVQTAQYGASPARSLLLGISMGLALLSRTITVFLIPLCALVLLYPLNRNGGRPSWVRNMIFFCVAAFAVAGWWYLRNWIYYEDPFLWKLHQSTVGAHWAREGHFTLMDLAEAAAFLHASFWVYFGRNEFHAGIAEYAAYLLLVVIAIWGVIEILIRRNQHTDFSEASFRRPAFLLFLAGALLATAEILLLQTRIGSPQGRYFFMAITPISVVLGSGLLKVMGAKRLSSGPVILAFALALFCLYLFWRYWAPHYL